MQPIRHYTIFFVLQIHILQSVFCNIDDDFSFYVLRNVIIIISFFYSKFQFNVRSNIAHLFVYNAKYYASHCYKMRCMLIATLVSFRSIVHCLPYNVA